jgi:outer membrane protein
LALVGALLLTALPAAAGKVGFVEVERALSQVKEGVAKFREIELWAEPRQQELEEMRDRLRELQQRLAQQTNVTSPGALERLQEEERELRRRFEDATRQFQRDAGVRQDEALKDVSRKFSAVVTDYAERNGFDAVFIMKDSMLVYLAEAADLTDAIVAEYDQRFPVTQ